MAGIDLSPTVWVDPLVAAFILAALYAPVKDFVSSRSRKSKDRTARDRVREDKLDQLLSDWHGKPARPGFPEIPGIPTRIYRIEHEIQHNSGGSIKDAVHRTDEAVADLRDEVKALQEKLEN